MLPGYRICRSPCRCFHRRLFLAWVQEASLGSQSELKLVAEQARQQPRAGSTDHANAAPRRLDGYSLVGTRDTVFRGREGDSGGTDWTIAAVGAARTVNKHIQ